jgi:soluble lytic murein transglycosylase-like protein
MDREKLITAIGILAVLGAAAGTVYILMPWQTKAELNAGDPLYGQLMALFSAAESQYGIPSGLLARQGYEESSFLPSVISGGANSAGAVGIMQFEPATAAQYGITNLNDPTQEIPGAAHYMSDLYTQFGAWSLALAAYDAGPGNVTKYGGIPPFTETENYVSQILSDVNAAGGPGTPIT